MPFIWSFVILVTIGPVHNCVKHTIQAAINGVTVLLGNKMTKHETMWPKLRDCKIAKNLDAMSFTSYSSHLVILVNILIMSKLEPTNNDGALFISMLLIFNSTFLDHSLTSMHHLS